MQQQHQNQIQRQPQQQGQSEEHKHVIVHSLTIPATSLPATTVAATPDGTFITEAATTEPEIDIVINNVVCSFSVRCHLNLRDIALKGLNVEYRRENGMVTMKLRRPYTTASIWSSGRITCTGATSEKQSLMLMPLLMAGDVQLRSRLDMLVKALVCYKDMCNNLEKELTNAKQLPVADQSI